MTTNRRSGPSHLAAAWLLLAAGLCSGGETVLPPWTDCLANGTLEVHGEGESRTLVPLAQPQADAYDFQAELRWTRRGRQGGAVDLLAGARHVVGSLGYRLVVSQEPWRVAEARAPRLEPGAWHAVELRVRPSGLEYWLGGRLVARVAAAPPGERGVSLVVAPGADAAVRLCRIREYTETAAGEAVEPWLAYPAPAFGHAGRALEDASAAGRRAVEASGRGKGSWLISGQDASLGTPGAYEAVFGLRAIQGDGTVWLEVARSGGETVAARAVRLEELPTRSYARVSVPFLSDASGPLEYRVAAEGGRLRLDEVVVEGGVAAPKATGLVARPRRALTLAKAWGKAPQGADGQRGPSLVHLARRLADNGWYEFTAAWRQDAAAAADGVAVDLWVAFRDEWGIVRVLDRGAAYDAVPRGEHETRAWVDPAVMRRYGPTVAFFAQVYWRGAPVAAAWRKWGIPVDDKYIVEAPAAGQLSAAGPTE